MVHRTMPHLKDLGDDLTRSTVLHRYAAVGLPVACVAAYYALATRGHWVPAVGCVMAYSFFSYGSASHDLVHGNLGFSPRANAFWLSFIELLGLRSGHAYRAAHLHHHARFPRDDDIEGRAAHRTFCGALRDGPLYSFRLWLWAVRRARRFRGLAAAEGTLCAALAAAALIASVWTYVPLAHAALALAGSWTFPAMTAYFPHRPRGADELHRTRRFRGIASRVIFLDHLYHLEHHLYPRVPRHRWARLARRLDPWLDERDIRAERIGW